jgi:hypothetical protein
MPVVRLLMFGLASCVLPKRQRNARSRAGTYQAKRRYPQLGQPLDRRGIPIAETQLELGLVTSPQAVVGAVVLTVECLDRTMH